MNNFFEIFYFNGHKYLFDGNTVEILEVPIDFNVNEYIRSENLQINSHRYNYLKTICLVLNNSCNLSCDYCFANKGKYDKPNEQMKFEDAQNALCHLISTVKKNKGSEITIAFFGGEPLLSFNLIKQVVEYMESYISDVACKYMITTNGILIDEEIVDFFEKYKFNVTISIDGDEEQHNFFRKYSNGKGSYKDVIRKISLFKNKKLINARITVASNNTNIRRAIRSILNLGIKRITFALDYFISDKDFNDFKVSFVNLIEDYIVDIKNGIYYDITNITSVLASIALHQKNKAHCNAGISYITLSADGKFYRCPRFVGQKEFCMGDAYSINILEENIKVHKRNLGKSAVNRNVNCSNCSYVYLCGGVCYHHSYTRNLSEYQNVTNECIQNKLIFEKTIELICRLNVNERSQFLLFLINIWNIYGKEKNL